MKIQALNNWVFVELLKTPNEIKSLDKFDKEKPSKARVLSVGDGEQAKLLNIKEGDIVVLRKWGVDDLEIDGEHFHPVLAQEIMAKVNEV